MKIRLGAATLDFYVDVRLRELGGRWLAVSVIGGEYEIGVGADIHDALADSLVSLGSHAATLLLSDPQLKVIEGRLSPPRTVVNRR